MNFEINVKADGTAVVTKITDPESFIIIPALLEGHTVNEVGNNIFPEDAKDKVTDLILPQTIRKVDSHAFDGLLKLKTLILNEGLEEIGAFGIFNCSSLVQIYVPATVKAIGNSATGFTGKDNAPCIQQNFTLICDKDSAAEKYCTENKINYKTKLIMA